MIVKQTFKDSDGHSYDWIDVENGSVDEITATANSFNLHPLCIETILEGGERPRVQDFESYSFIVLQPVTSTSGELEFGELYAVLSKMWVLTFHKSPLREIEELRKVSSGSKVMVQGPDFLFYSVLSRVLESYYSLADVFEGKLEILEESITETSSEPVLTRMIGLRRDVVSTRRIFSYTREVVATMLREDFYDLNDEDERYYRDAHFQLSHLLESVETYREFLADLRDSYMSAVSLSLNQVMKKLTMVGTIALPLIVVSGIFGMNLQGLPVSQDPNGGVFVVLMMVVFSLVLGLYFRAKHWV